MMETKDYIYFDNSATTSLCPEARAAMARAMEDYGNPSSLHGAGMKAHETLEGARASVFASLGIRNPRSGGSLLFTSCGTEASNTALIGCAFAKERRESDLIITTDSEHPSVANTVKYLESHGFRAVRISTRGGRLDFDMLEKALREKPFMISMMMVNNETGAVYDVKRAFAMAKAANENVVTHCDAVQGYLKVRFTPQAIGADLMTVSAHKIHGPKGVGALYISPAVTTARKLTGFIHGGGQEGGMRPGTENMIGIAGFGAAAEAGMKNFAANVERMTAIRDYAEQKLSELELTMNIPAGDRAPHILNITLPSIKSETMLHYLSQNGICVSSGSACSSRAAHPSESLIAFGLTPAEADHSLRISFCEYNTEAEVDKLYECLKQGIATLVRTGK